MTFEVFKGKKMRLAGREPGVSISKAGIFTINNLCMSKYLDGATRIELLFDKAGKRIGFRPVKTDEMHNYTLRPVKGMGQLSGAAFLQNEKGSVL